MKHIVSFSGGKDSTAMLLMMLERNMPVDEIVFADTRKEFPELYDNVEKVRKYIRRPITVLEPKNDFNYYMYEHIKTKGKQQGQAGYGWPTVRCRWCTSVLKTKPITDYITEKYGNDDVLEYIGIAADEPNRIKNKIYPLFQWKISEYQALEYCYYRGFNWNNLYEKLNRVSCYCCPYKNLRELKVIYINFPTVWNELKDMDYRAYNQYRADYSIKDLEIKFIKELESMIDNIHENSDIKKVIKKLNEVINHLNYKEKTRTFVKILK